MDYNVLLDLVTDLGYRLAMSGAETFRIEESINRILKSYGLEAEVFAIPNCLIVSTQTSDGTPMTRMRRIGQHGNDLDAVERYSNLSRRICMQKPTPDIAHEWLQQADSAQRSYRLPFYLLGNFFAAFGFAILFNCNFTDSLISGVCGLIVGVVTLLMDKLHANSFFRIIVAAFCMSLPAYLLNTVGIAHNADGIVIGALMLLVPGLLFTNALRDIIYGDTNSGVNRIVQVFLIAIAIALGTAAAWSLTEVLIATPVSINICQHSIWIQLIGCAFGCMGFSILFNIHGPGGLLCMLGGLLTWAAYCIVLGTGGSDIAGYFWATCLTAVYAEVMARIRKYPAISYLVVSAFPLIPGAGVYYALNHAIQGNMDAFGTSGAHTLALAGVMAVGMLLVSTFFRILSTYRQNRRELRK